jgi:hypothetical protein
MPPSPILPLVRRGRLRITANLGADVQRLPLGAAGGEVLLSSAAGTAIADDAVSMPPASFAVLRV